MQQDKKNFIWNFLGLTINNFNSLFFLVIVQRINGITVTGMFSYGYAVACVLYMLSLFFNRSFQLSEEKYFDKTFVYVRFLTCLFSFLLSVAIAFLSIHALQKFFIIILLCLFRNIEAASDVLYGIVHKRGRLDYSGKSLFLKGILGIVAFFIVDFLTKNIILAILSLIAVNVIGICFDVFFTKSICRKITLTNTVEYNKTELKPQMFSTLKASFPVFIFSTLGLLLLNMQKYIIGLFYEDAIGAVFNIIVMPATVMTLCGTYFINPYIAKLKIFFNASDLKGFCKLNAKLGLVLFSIGVFVCIVAWLIGVYLMEIIFGMELKQYTLFICVIIFSSIFYALMSLLSTSLTIMEKNKSQSVIFAVVAFSTAVASYFAMKLDVLSGAVWCYVGSMIMLFVSYLTEFVVVVRKKHEIK